MQVSSSVHRYKRAAGWGIVLLCCVVFAIAPFVLYGLLFLAPLTEREREIERELAEKRFQKVLEQLHEGCPYFCLYEDDWLGADEQLRRACEIRHLTHVNLERTDVSDLGLKYLADLPKLQVLVLSRVHVTDRGIKPLANTQSSIQTLVLDRTMGTADGLVALRTLSHLEHLLYDADIADPTDRRAVESIVAALKELRGLKTLEIGGNWVSDDIVRDLQGSHRTAVVRRLKDGDDRWFYQGVCIPPWELETNK